MNASNIDSKPRVAKETKNKIKVDFERTPLKDRLKAKFLTMSFLTKVIWLIFRLVLLIGVSYVVIMPFIKMVTRSFMDVQDFLDPTVWYIPKHYTLDIYKAIITDLRYFEAFLNTFLLSSVCAILQTFFCCLIAYGLAKFKFKGNKFIFLAVVFTMVVPHGVIGSALEQWAGEFDIFGIFKLLGGGGITIFGHHIDVPRILPETWENFTKQGIFIKNTFWPFIIISVTGLAFKNGLYIFLLRQFFRGVPDELEESAYIDGSNTFRTFLQIILPLSVPMMITVFLFAFSWQWTDSFYIGKFSGINGLWTMNSVASTNIPSSLTVPTQVEGNYKEAVGGAAGVLIILPLVLLYLFGQRYIVQGIERSGITG